MIGFCSALRREMFTVLRKLEILAQHSYDMIITKHQHTGNLFSIIIRKLKCYNSGFLAFRGFLPCGISPKAISDFGLPATSSSSKNSVASTALSVESVGWVENTENVVQRSSCCIYSAVPTNVMGDLIHFTIWISLALSWPDPVIANLVFTICDDFICSPDLTQLLPLYSFRYFLCHYLPSDLTQLLPTSCHYSSFICSPIWPNYCIADLILLTWPSYYWLTYWPDLGLSWSPSSRSSVGRSAGGRCNLYNSLSLSGSSARQMTPRAHTKSRKLTMLSWLLSSSWKQT